jgi:L-threonylcarbamoyladenylate synthase
MVQLASFSEIVSADEDVLDALSKYILNQGIVAFPTETVYGLGGLASSSNAILSIFRLKGRPASNPLIVHLSSLTKVEDVALLRGSRAENRMERLVSRIDALIPGPLTLVLPARLESTAPEVRAGGSTIAIRVPRHPIAQAFLDRVAVPIAAPSANRSTHISPTKPIHVLEEFPDAGIPILDGGNCQIGLESTVIDITCDNPSLLRPGFITQEMLEDVLQERVTIAAGHLKHSSTIPLPARSPGQMSRHYSPRTPLYRPEHLSTLLSRPLKIGWVCFSARDVESIYLQQDPPAHLRILSPEGDINEAASQLYSTLRELDHQNLDAIVVDHIPEMGVGKAILDRLARARAR